MDIDDLRAAAIQINGLTKADAAYTLYYDETNNIRRLHVTEDGFNVVAPQCFVLGGIAHIGAPHDLAFEDLRKALRLQPSTTDLKLKHVATGDVFQVLASPRLQTFLEWLLAAGHFIHLQAIDPLYWSTVDIIDSILAASPRSGLAQHHARLKNDLHQILRHPPSLLVELFRRYSYPNVGPDRTADFIHALLQIVEARWDIVPAFNAQMLKGALQLGRGIETLPFLEVEQDHILISSFSHFYLNRIYMLKNATHILDTEPEIIEQVERTPLRCDGRPLRNFRFVERSHDEPGIQISDVVVGLFGKLVSWTIGASPDDIEVARDVWASFPFAVRSLAALRRSSARLIEDRHAATIHSAPSARRPAGRMQCRHVH